MGLSRYRLNAQIAVTDMTRAAEFYEGKLGLTAVQTGADGSKVYASGGDEALVVYWLFAFDGGECAVVLEP